MSDKVEMDSIVEHLNPDVIRAVKDIIKSVQWMQDNFDMQLNLVTEFRACTENLTNEKTRAGVYAVFAKTEDYDEFVNTVFPAAVEAYKTSGGAERTPVVQGIQPRKGATA